MTQNKVRVTSVASIILSLTLTACSPGGLGTPKDSPFAPGLDPNGKAADGLIVGHRLMDAEEFDLALDAYSRAASQQGFTPEVLASLGSANLRLGRLGQAEENLRDAIAKDATRPEAWNNLGVVLMERDKIAEASQVFKRAFALDNGESDAIRDNLRLALAKLENPSYDGPQLKDSFKLVRRGSNDYLLSKTP